MRVRTKLLISQSLNVALIVGVAIVAVVVAQRFDNELRRAELAYDQRQTITMLAVQAFHYKTVIGDVLFDGRAFHEFASPRIETRSTHGTGCTFASAIAAFLARQEAVPDAVRRAKDYLTEALRRAEPIGHGHGPVNHFWQWRTE